MSKLYYSDGQVVEYKDSSLAYQVWLSAPKGVRIAFRSDKDERPVLPWDYADKI